MTARTFAVVAAALAALPACRPGKNAEDDPAGDEQKNDDDGADPDDGVVAGRGGQGGGGGQGGSGGTAGDGVRRDGGGSFASDAHSFDSAPRTDGGGGSRDAGGTDVPPGVGCGAPPATALYVWLTAARGVTTDGQGQVTAWANQAGPEVARAPTDARAPKGRPLLATTPSGGKVVRFRGNPDLQLDPASDLLQMNVTVDKEKRLTIALVNATTRAWLSDPGEWCKRATATGCSSTYNWVFGWSGVTGWSGVFVSPRDTEVGWRFGPGMNLDSHCFVGGNTSGPDPCMKWPRPATIGTRLSATVMIHDERENRLYVDGTMVHAAPIAHGVAAVDTAPPLNIGNNTFAHNGGGDLAEALVYKDALDDDARAALDRYLRCTHGLP